jgi:hypothetical protein
LRHGSFLGLLGQPRWVGQTLVALGERQDLLKESFLFFQHPELFGELKLSMAISLKIRHGLFHVP